MKVGLVIAVALLSISASLSYRWGNKPVCRMLYMSTKPLDDKEFEELLMGDPSTPPPAIAASSNAPTTTKTVTQDNFEKCVTILAKCNVNQLREVILKYKPSALPAEDADVETHVTQALDSYWSINNGDWPGLIKNIEVIHYLTHQPFVLPDRLTDPKDDLLKHADDQSKYIKQAVDLTNLLSQERIISLIIEYGDKSYLPKLNRNKHEGKFLKGDYIAVYLDIMRELNGNNYRTVCEQIEKETRKGNLEMKKGFSK